MTQDEIDQLPSLVWMPSRIPKRRALVAFVPDLPECPSAIKAELDKRSSSRWYPEPGGHRLLILYEGGTFDPTAFRLEDEAWDHEDCDTCGEQIAPMELCHVTRSGPYIALCATCYHRFVPLGPTSGI